MKNFALSLSIVIMMFATAFVFWLIWTFFGIGLLFTFLPISLQHLSFWQCFGVAYLKKLLFATSYDFDIYKMLKDDADKKFGE